MPAQPFSDPEAVARYAEKTAQLVPGLADLHRMTALLLAEQAGDEAEVLVLGAGGGLELKQITERQPRWRLTGVDPSAEMLALARTTLGALQERVSLHEGYISDAPEGPFDAASCLLTLHFLPEQERRETLAALHGRLRPGAPLVVAHHSLAEGPERARWLARYTAFAADSGVPAAQAKTAGETIGERLPLLSPERDEALLREAGFDDVALFYAGFTFRGWVCRRARCPGPALATPRPSA